MFAGYMIKDISAYFEVVELALKHGKKPGDLMTEEFQEIMKKRPEAFEFLGVSNKDADMLTGDLREEGLKILNINEIDRKIDNEK